MPTSNGFTTPAMPAMADVGSNRALTSTLPSPATLPEPGASKIGGSRLPTKLNIKAPTLAGQPQRTLPTVNFTPKQAQQPISTVPLNDTTKQQRMQALQNYVSRLNAGSAEHPAAFLQSISHLM